MYKLARTERMLGKHQAAAERLRTAGPPRSREDDWTIEYGETLLALKQASALRELIGPWMRTHEGHPQGELLIGSAFYLQSANDEAVPHLERSLKAGEARARPVLVEVLNTLAAESVKKSDLPTAKARLEAAQAAGGSPMTTRNLGAVLIAQNEFDRAIAVLKSADDGTELHLLARAYQGAKKLDDARAAYTKSVKAYGKDPRAVTVLRDFANAEIAAGRGEEAMAVLDQAVALAPAASKKEVETARVNVARLAATEAMRASRYLAAVKLLRAVEKSVEGQALTELRCDLALAATGATQRDLALELLRGLERSKAKCAFAAPADDVGVPILIAWNEDPLRAKLALDRLETFRRRATGVAEPLLRQAGGDIALRAAADAYNKGNVKGAAAFLNRARNYDRRSPELAHNLAVIELLTGQVDNAIPTLNALVGEVPEARINLGIAYEKKGDPQKALATWKAAAQANVRWAALKDWIEAKERFWGAQ
jgi:tetratricopeptide (TPR) repeat protein